MYAEGKMSPDNISDISVITRVHSALSIKQWQVDVFELTGQ